MLSKLKLNGKRALIGGSTQGIGKSIAIEMAKLGAEVVLIARNEDRLKSTLQELDNSMGQTHSYIVADYSHPDVVMAGVSEFINSNGPIHIVVNNTGGPPGGKVIDAQIEEFQTAFNQHLICYQIIAKLVVDGMKKEGYGRLINIISTSVKQPIPNLGVSNTIRGAVAQWAKTLATELAEFGITVNNILPGMTKTQRLISIMDNRAKMEDISVAQAEANLLNTIPANRFATAEEMGYAAAFLASPAASYITGINLPVDGGRTKSL